MDNKYSIALIFLILLVVGILLSCITIYTDVPTNTVSESDISEEELEPQINSQFQPSTQSTLEESQANHKDGWNAIQAEPSTNFSGVDSEPFPGEYLNEEDNSNSTTFKTPHDLFPPGEYHDSFITCPSRRWGSGPVLCLKPDEAANLGYTEKCSEEPCNYSLDDQQFWYCYSKPETPTTPSYPSSPAQLPMKVVRPDLIVTDMWKKGPTDWHYVVKNQGNTVAGSSRSALRLNNNLLKVLDIAPLSVGESRTEIFNYALKCVGEKEYSWSIEVDSLNNIAEINEGNNIRSEMFLCP